MLLLRLLFAGICWFLYLGFFVLNIVMASEDMAALSIAVNLSAFSLVTFLGYVTIK